MDGSRAQEAVFQVHEDCKQNTGQMASPKTRALIWVLTSTLQPTLATSSPEQSSQEPRHKRENSRKGKTLTCLKNGQDSFAW